MSCKKIVSLLIVLASVSPSTYADDTEATELVTKSDEIRFPQAGFQAEIQIISKTGEQNQEAHRYRVLSRNNNNTIVQTLEPAADRGQLLLMKERDLWLFMPSVSQPIRLSVSQRLTGEVAYGDIARANFSGDYHAKKLRTEDFDGQTYVVIELTAAEKGTTYSRVLYWVNQKNYRPYKAEFYSVSNRLLKTCRYEDFKVLAGETRPTRLTMQDGLKKDEVSVLEYLSIKPRDLPEKVFTKDYLKKLD